MSAFRGSRLFLAAAFGALALSGCSFVESKDPPLPGDRIAVMLDDSNLRADPAIVGKPVAVAPPVANSTWSQTGGSATHTAYHPALGASPRQVWRTGAGEGADKEKRLLAQPVVDSEGRVYVLDVDARVSAIDVASGRRIWSRPLRGEEEGDTTLGGGLAVADGRLYVTTGFAQVIGMEAASGKVLWRQRVSAPFRSGPAVADGRIFATSNDNQTHALDAATGNVLWTHRGATETPSLLGGAAPAYESGVVVVAYSTGELFGLRATNGGELWSDYLARTSRTSQVGQISDIRASPVIDRGRVIAVSNSGRMVAVNILTGARIWDLQLASIYTPWVAGDYIYALSTDGVLVCIGRAEGRIRWARSVPRWANPRKQEDRITWTGPVLAGDRIIMGGSNRDVLAISPYSGDLLGKVRMPDPVSVTPVVARNTLFIFTDDADLIALR